MSKTRYRIDYLCAVDWMPQQTVATGDGRRQRDPARRRSPHQPLPLSPAPLPLQYGYTKAKDSGDAQQRRRDTHLLGYRPSTPDSSQPANISGSIFCKVSSSLAHHLPRCTMSLSFPILIFLLCRQLSTLRLRRSSKAVHHWNLSFIDHIFRDYYHPLLFVAGITSLDLSGTDCGNDGTFLPSTEASYSCHLCASLPSKHVHCP